MKRNKLMITFLSATAFAVGCNKEGTTSQQLDKAQVKTEEAAQSMQDYSYAQKTQFVEKMQGQLAALKRELDELADGWRVGGCCHGACPPVVVRLTFAALPGLRRAEPGWLPVSRETGSLRP